MVESIYPSIHTQRSVGIGQWEFRQVTSLITRIHTDVRPGSLEKGSGTAILSFQAPHIPDEQNNKKSGCQWVLAFYQSAEPGLRRLFAGTSNFSEHVRKRKSCSMTWLQITRNVARRWPKSCTGSSLSVNRCLKIKYPDEWSFTLRTILLITRREAGWNTSM